MLTSLKKQIAQDITVKKSLLNNTNLLQQITAAIHAIISCLRNHHKLLIAGNGGSASQAHHLAAELINQFRLKRPAWPAISLTADTAVLTAISNDSGFDFIFSRQIEALGQKGDSLIILTTSDADINQHGHSVNLLQALVTAKKYKLITIGLISEKTKKLLKLIDFPIIAPSTDTPRVQEIHSLIIHLICEEVEKGLVIK